MTAPFPGLTGTEPCTTGDPDRFFPNRDQGAQGRAAKVECEDCPLRDPCLDYALRTDVHGIWGGTTRRERCDMRRRLKIVADPVVPSYLNRGQVRRMIDRGTPPAVVAVVLGCQPDAINQIVRRDRAAS